MVFGPSGVAVALVLRSKTERAIHMWDPMGLPSTRDPIRSLVQGVASSSVFHLAYAHHLLMQVKMLMMMVLNRCAYN